MLFQPAVVLGAILVVLSLTLYSITLAPDVLAHDSGDWQAAGATLGIGHAPGSPAYIIIAWLFSLVPLGEAAARINFLSAVVGAAGVGACYWLTLLLFGRLLPALVSAVTLAVAGLWWSHATVATPYNVIPAAIALSLALLLHWRRSGGQRLPFAVALLMGTGISYHPTLMFFLPIPLAAVFILAPWRQLLRKRMILLIAGFFMLGLSFYLYLPIRSAMDPPVHYQRIDAVSSFINYVSASDARAAGQGHGVLKMPDAGEFKNRLSDVIRQSYFPSYAFLVLGPAIVLLYPRVWPALRRRGRPLAFVAAAAFAHMAIVFALTGVYTQYYMPMILYFSIWAGLSVFLIMEMGEAYLERSRLRQVPVIVTAVIYFAVILIGVWQKWDFVDHGDNRNMRSYAQTVFAQAQPDAAILANWDSYTGLMYLQQVDGIRRDVRLFSVGRDDLKALATQIRSEAPQAQLLLAVTLPYEQEAGLRELAGPFPLDTKGRTYQDLVHGEPFPASVVLYEVATTDP